MRLQISIDRSSTETVFRQIAEAIRSEVLSGNMAPGSRLPTVRALAVQTGTANQTVATAYRLLVDWGIVEGRVGSGTFVARDLPSDTAAGRLAGLVGQGPIAEFETLSAAGGLRSLATAVPDPAFFHSDELLAEISDLRACSPWAFYYAPPSGMTDLRIEICRLLESRGIEAQEPEVLTTHGAMHALALLVDELCHPGDEVLLESPGFLGAYRFFETRGLQVRRIDVSVDGLNLDQVESEAKKGAKVLVCWPTFGSASGVVMPLEGRHHLLELARRHKLTVIEDVHYTPIAFGRTPPSLLALAQGDEVVQIDSLSGYLSAGLRTGWIVCSPQLRLRLEERIRMSGTGGVAFLQTAMATFLARGRLPQHLRRVIPRYRVRRDALVGALAKNMPREVRWTHPEGGYSTWLTFPSGPDVDTLYAHSLRRGVAFAPGTLFDREARTSLRLSFGVQEPEAIGEAVASLAESLVALGRRS